MSNVVEAILCVPVLVLWFGPALLLAALPAAFARRAPVPRSERRPTRPRPFDVARLRRA